jgi:phosphate transport system substrate-binding protein
LSLTGPSACERFVNDAATEYVRVAATAQPVYTPSDSDLLALAAFVSESAAAKEALILEDRPSDKALGTYGKRWNDLSPAEHVFAGRAATVVVNAGSKLDSLTAEQVQSIFSGDAKDWKTLSTGATPLPAGRIARYGLPGHEAAAKVFYKECLPAEKMAAVTTKKDTADVLSALSGDPLGIAFVDLAALPIDPAKTGVKVLAIGPAGKAVMPTAENIRNAMYPFSQRLFLYVHPKASDTAKDFAKFIATCGQSEASPYTDTVKALAETYRKHGLIPLAVLQPARSLFPTSAPAK